MDFSRLHWICHNLSRLGADSPSSFFVLDPFIALTVPILSDDFESSDVISVIRPQPSGGLKQTPIPEIVNNLAYQIFESAGLQILEMQRIEGFAQVESRRVRVSVQSTTPFLRH
jgi:hypothetical protein